jgi:hypothetical protein
VSPIFEPSEHSLDTVASFVTALEVLNGLFARVATGDAGRCAVVYKGFTVPISIVPSVSEEPVSLRQTIHQVHCTSIITDLSCCDEEADWSSAGVCDSM